MNNQRGNRLRLWKERLAVSDAAYRPEVAKMDKREALYNGSRDLNPLVEGEQHGSSKKQTNHVRNIIFENIETQISSSIPYPKVTPRRKKDEYLAQIIEHFIRNELDRLPFEMMNDMAERTVPIQGGVGFLVEWDNTKRTHMTVGETTVSVIHPKQFAPQPGIYTGIADMDWFILKIPTTKNAIWRKYGKSVYQEGESEPEIRGGEGYDLNDDAVTQYIGFEVNEQSKINRYSWVNDVELEDLENYQARRQPVCSHCGRVRPLPGQILYSDIPANDSGAETDLAVQSAVGVRLFAQKLAASEAEIDTERWLEIGASDAEPVTQKKYDGGPCPWCGCEKFTDQEMEYEEIMVPMTTAGGVHIPGAQPGIDAMGAAVMLPTRIPFYKPDLFPIILQKSVSVYGKLLGNSDVDAIADQQNTINRIEQKILDRLLKAGTRITLPSKARMNIDPEDGDVWHLDNPADKSMIDVYDFKGDLEYELLYLNQLYEESRQILGITDSFQGRRDPTATSGVAKEQSAARAAGRLESKRIMKNAAYAQMFELMFKFWLAYSDEPRPVSFKNYKGQTEYQEFNRYDFLEQDADGQWYWNDQFLFSCDTSAPLASDREAMWKETRMNLQTGAFGDPAATQTLILFWGKMEEQHYPGAGYTKRFLEDKLEQERQQMLMQTQSMPNQGGAVPMQQGAAQQVSSAMGR